MTSILIRKCQTYLRHIARYYVLNLDWVSKHLDTPGLIRWWIIKDKYQIACQLETSLTWSPGQRWSLNQMARHSSLIFNSNYREQRSNCRLQVAGICLRILNLRLVSWWQQIFSWKRIVFYGYGSDSLWSFT